MSDKGIKLILGLGIIFLYLWLGFIAYHCWELRNLNGDFIEKLVIQNKISQAQLKECQRYNIFQQVVSEIGKREYSSEYNCYDHAKDLQSGLRELDIESSILINSGRNHAWVGVWIETTTGQFISPDNNFEIMEIR